MKRKKYGYMIKTINEKFQGYEGFQYSTKIGDRIECTDWNADNRCCGGIFGSIHGLKDFYIQNGAIWMILKYEIGTEVIVEDQKIKVPFCWIESYGTAGEMQSKFQKLTGCAYVYNWAIQTASGMSTQTAGYGSTQTAGSRSTQTASGMSTQTAGDESIQIAGGMSTQNAGDGSNQTAGSRSNQTAGSRSTQTAGYGSTQVAGHLSTQVADYGSNQTAGDGSIQISGHGSTQTAGGMSIQTASGMSTQTAGDGSNQTAGDGSTQTAGDWSKSNINGLKGTVAHVGLVLQSLTFRINNEMFIVTELRKWDGKKYAISAVKTDDGYKMLVEACK
jgi:hypothetical protein